MKVDIRTKLKMQDKPEIVITDKVTIKVSTDAMGLLQAMNIFEKGEEITASDIHEILSLLYTPEDIERIKSLRLDMTDFMTVINESISIATGADESEKN